MRKGQIRQGDIVEVAVREFEKATKNIRGRKWIVTGRRQATLRAALEECGYTITGSFAEENRAARSASSVRRKQAGITARRAKKEGQAPRKKQATQVETPKLTGGRTSPRPRLGLPTPRCASLPMPHRTPCSKGSMCFVASNGDYRLRTRETSASTDELGRESLTLALKYLLKVGATKANIESDSVAALEAVEGRLCKSAALKHRGRGARGVGCLRARGRDSSKRGAMCGATAT